MVHTFWNKEVTGIIDFSCFAVQTTSATAVPVKGGTLNWLYVYSLQKAPGWPTDTTNVQRVLLAWTVFEPLVRLGLDGVPQPYFATSWKWAPDYKSITSISARASHSTMGLHSPQKQS
jgi:hypothetical protein